jgi:hypothetical protein
VHGFPIEVVLYLFFAMVIKLTIKGALSITAKMEVNMETIIKTMCVVGGVALLGRSG